MSRAGQLAALTLLVTLYGCSDRTDGGAPATPVYTMSDTTAYENLVASGRYALLRRGDLLIDTIDVDFGAPVVGRDSVLFLPVRSTPDGAGGVVMTITDHVLFDGATRQPVSDFAPHFDSQFSSPSVLDGALYYWGIRQVNGEDSIQAVRYEFRRKRLNALPVDAKVEGTDNRFYFTPPHLERKEIVFQSPTGRWTFRTPRQ